MSPYVYAVDVSYSAATEITSYENLNLQYQSPGNELSESIRASLSISENTADLVSNLNFEIESINFKENQANDETVFSLLADALLSLSPNRFEWFVSEVYAQTPIDSLIGDISTNRQAASAFSTGPNYHIRINQSNMLTFEVRAGNYQYEIDDADNNRLSGQAIWSLTVNPHLEFSFNYEVESVNFTTENIYVDYERHDSFFAIDIRRGFNLYEVEIGMTNIDYSNTEATNEPRYLLAVETIRNSLSSLRLEAYRSITDTANLLESQIGEELHFYNLTSTNSDLFVSDVIRVVYNHELSLGSYTIQLNTESNEYENLLQENFDRHGAILRFEWFIRQDKSISFESRFYNIDRYNVAPQSEVNDYYYSLGYRYNANRNIVLNYQASYQERDSINILETYTDTRFMVSLIYTTT